MHSCLPILTNPLPHLVPIYFLPLLALSVKYQVGRHSYYPFKIEMATFYQKTTPHHDPPDPLVPIGLFIAFSKILNNHV